MRKRKIAIADAKSITEACKQIISDPFFTDHIEKEDFLFKDLMNLTELEKSFLTKPNIKKLLSEKIISLKIALSLSLELKNLLDLDGIIKLLINKKITIEELAKLPYRSARLIHSNELVFDLINQGIIPIAEIPKILNKNARFRATEIVSATPELPTTPEQKAEFNNWLKDYLQLAAQGILFAGDLNYLHNNFSTISAEITSRLTSDKKDENLPLQLLQSKTIHTRCIKNIIKRINSLFIDDPQELHEEKQKDSFALINKACSLIGVNFINLTFNELIEQMHGAYSNFASLSIKKIVSLGIKLGMEKEKLWGIAHAIRAFAISEGLPSLIGGKRDSVEAITMDMHITQEKEHLLSVEFSLHFFKHLQQLIKEEFETNMRTLPSDELKKLHGIIEPLEIKTAESPSQLLEKRIQAFNELINLAKEITDDARVQTYLQTDSGTKKRVRESKEESSVKRNRTSLFPSDSSSDNRMVLRNLCNGIIRLESVIKPHLTSRETPTLSSVR